MIEQVINERSETAYQDVVGDDARRRISGINGMPSDVTVEKHCDQKKPMPGDGHANKFGGIPGWLTPDEATKLEEVCKDKVVLEIGSYCGRSTIAIARVANVVYALDWHHGDQIIGDTDTLGEFHQNVTKAMGRLNNVTYLVGRTIKFMPLLKGNWADVVFVDGAHDENSVAEDLRLAKQVLKDGGTIILHDWDRPQVQSAFAKEIGPGPGPEETVQDRLHVVHNVPIQVQSNAKKLLDKELENLEHQRQVKENAIAKAELVKEVAQRDMVAINGAKQMVNHLLAKINSGEMQ